MLAAPITLDSRVEWLDLRRRFVGASDVAALVGAHPYKSAYRLWLEKTGQLTYDPEAEIAPQLERGQELEPIALKKLARQHPEWRVEPNPMPGGIMLTNDETRMAATPDAFLTDPARGRGICQIKSVEPHVFRRDWARLPVHVEIQASVEAAMSGVSWATAAALVVAQGIDLHVVEIPLDPDLMPLLEERVAEFWRLVDARIEPTPDYERDHELIRRFAPPEHDPSLTVRFDHDDEFCNAAVAYRDLGRLLSLDKKEHKRLGAILIHKMGEASVGLARDVRVTLKTQDTQAYTVAAKSTRVLRIANPRKEDDE
jgi:putative phage-type endonuclease